MPFGPDQVYRAEHLRFATMDPSRGKPTLYFRTPHGSGRLRQAHGSGAKVQKIRMHTSHAFFADSKNFETFKSEFKPGMTRKEFRSLRKRYGGRHTPTESAFHFEATFNAHGPEGEAYIGHHSGGRVVGAATLEVLRKNVGAIYGGMK